VAVANTPDGAALPRLLAAPEPLKGESRGSWVQRLCGEHQYSMRRLREVTGIRPDLSDWDRAVPPWQWNGLLTMAGVAVDSCAEAIRGLSILSRACKGFSFFLHDAGKPRYRWCAQCLGNDAVPYLRWEWRLARLTHCTVHETALEHCCPWCGSGLHTHRAILVSAGRSVGVPDLASCAVCGMALLDFNRENVPQNSTSETSNDFLHDVLLQLKQGDALDAVQLELSFSLCIETQEVTVTPQVISTPQVIVSEPLDEEVDRFGARLHIERMLDLLAYPLRIDGFAFLGDHAQAGPTNLGPRKWSRLLRPTDRARLATALRTIRREKRLQRLESYGVPPTEKN
jgi:TniQ